MNYQILIEGLTRYRKTVFTREDVMRIFPEVKPRDVSTMLSRWVQRHDIIALKRGYYKTYTDIIDHHTVGAMIYPESYLSLETVLTKYKILLPTEFIPYKVFDLNNTVSLIHPC